MALVNALFVRWAGGYHVVEEPVSIAEHGRREGYLTLGSAQSIEQVERAARAFFDQWAQPAVAVTARIEPTGSGDRPFADFDLADWLSVPDEAGDPSPVRLRSLTVSEDPEGNPIFDPELGTPHQDHETRLNRWLQRMADGTVGGTALAASPLSNLASSFEKVDPFGDGTGGGPTTVIGARAYRNGSYPFSNVDASTLIDLNAEEYDYAGMWDAGNPTVLTVPVGFAGLWLLIGQVTYQAEVTGTGGRYAVIHKNGVKVVAIGTRPTPEPLNWSVQCVVEVDADVGDEFSLVGKQTSPGTLNIIGGDPGTTWLSASYRGPRP